MSSPTPAPLIPVKPEPAAPAPLTFPELPGGEQEQPLLHYWLVVQRQLWKIIAVAFVVTLVTAIYVLRLPKEYASTAVVRLDMSSPSASLSNQSNLSSVADAARMLETDRVEATSSSVVIPTILRMQLNRQPGAAVEGSSNPVPDKILRAVTSRISISVPANTYLLNITFRSHSPQQAAAVANTLAQEFINHEFKTRSAALLNLSQYMRGQLNELRARMEQSQLALNQFERSNNIVNPENTTSLLSQNIAELQKEWEGEQEQQRQLEANLQLVKRGDLNALLVSQRGQALQPLIRAEQQQELQLDTLGSYYGQKNYHYLEAKRNLARIRKTIRAEEQNITAQTQAQAQSHAMLVQLTGQQLDLAKLESERFNTKAVQYDFLKQEANTNKSLYDDLLRRLNYADISAGYRSNALRVISPARPNSNPVAPRVALDIGLAAVFSLLIGVFVSITLSNYERTMMDPESVRMALGFPVLGSLPSTRDRTDLVSLQKLPTQSQHRRSSYAEAVLSIRSALLLGSENRFRLLAITSAQPREGKSTTAANLSLAFAHQGMRTVLVDADIRRPTAHQLFGLSNLHGLSTLLQSAGSIQQVVQPAGLEMLHVITAGPSIPNPSDLIATRMGAILEELKSRFDIVVVDTPPLLGFSDTLTISTMADAVVLVIRAGDTAREIARTAIDQLRHVRANFAGIILNAVSPKMSHYYSYYQYHKYYSGDDDNQHETTHQLQGGSNDEAK